MRYVELRRHTDNEGDRLTPQGPADAEMTGRAGCTRLMPRSCPPARARATQMLEILRHAAGQDDTPITAAPGLRSSVEDRWRDAAKAAGKQADLEDIRAIDPDLAGRESWLLGSALRQVVAGLPEGRRALVVGHSPTHRDRRARARRPRCPATGQGQRGSASRGRRGLPGGAAGLNGVRDGGSARKPGAGPITQSDVEPGRPAACRFRPNELRCPEIRSPRRAAGYV